MLMLLLAATATTAMVPDPSMAQSSTNTTANQTTTSTENASTSLTPVFGDPRVDIESYSFSGDTLTVTFRSTAYVPSLTLTAPPEGEKQGASSGRAKQLDLTRGTTTVTMYAPTGEVWISTAQSLQNGRFTNLDADGSSSIVPPGPYDATDARDVGIGAAAGVAVAHLWVAVRAKLGSADRAERVA